MLHVKFEIHGWSGVRESHLNDLKARVDVNCEQKTDGRTDALTENRTPMSHPGKADATKINK